MGESSWALRIALLLIGIAAVGAVYLFGVVRRRQRNRGYRRRVQVWPGAAKTDYDDAVDEDGDYRSDSGSDYRRDLARDLGNDSGDDEIIAVRVRKNEPLADLPVIKNEAAEISSSDSTAEAAAPLSRGAATRSRLKRRKTPQLDFAFGETDLAADEAPRRRRKLPPPEPAILMLYLRPTDGPAFAGPSIVRNVNAVGMRHGDRQIFHHYGAGDLRTEHALFSLANMFEPGHFDMQRIEAFQTAGLVMFLNLPAALDGPVAFELFLNSAQRLAEGLQAELLAEPKMPLDSASINRLRRTAALFVNHEG